MRCSPCRHTAARAGLPRAWVRANLRRHPRLASEVFAPRHRLPRSRMHGSGGVAQCADRFERFRAEADRLVHCAAYSCRHAFHAGQGSLNVQALLENNEKLRRSLQALESCSIPTRQRPFSSFALGPVLPPHVTAWALLHAVFELHILIVALLACGLGGGEERLIGHGILLGRWAMEVSGPWSLSARALEQDFALRRVGHRLWGRRHGMKHSPEPCGVGAVHTHTRTCSTCCARPRRSAHPTDGLQRSSPPLSKCRFRS